MTNFIEVKSARIYKGKITQVRLRDKIPSQSFIYGLINT